MTEPPKIRYLNFDRYHPLDHVIGSRRCREHFGGPRHHVALWWEFRFQPRLARATTCRLNRHHEVDGWRDGERFKTCWYCGDRWEH